jgi:hypothetical protein
MESPATVQRIGAILDAELSRKVEHLLEQPIAQSSVSKRIGQEIDLHVPYIVKKVNKLFVEGKLNLRACGKFDVSNMSFD